MCMDLPHFPQTANPAGSAEKTGLQEAAEPSVRLDGAGGIVRRSVDRRRQPLSGNRAGLVDSTTLALPADERHGYSGGDAAGGVLDFAARSGEFERTGNAGGGRFGRLCIAICGGKG